MSMTPDDAIQEMTKLLAWVEDHRARCWPESLNRETEILPEPILPDPRWFDHFFPGPGHQMVAVCRRCGERTTIGNAE